MAPGFILIHGYCLWFAWTFFGLFQISTNRYMKHHWENHLWMHRISGAVLLATVLFYAGYALYTIGFPLAGDMHAPMGLAVLIAILFIVLSGVIARSRLNRATSNQSKVMIFKNFHKFVGHLMILTAQTTVFFGIYSYSVNHEFETILYWLSAGFFLIVWFFLELRH